MPTILLVEKSGAIKEVVTKNETTDDLYKKAGLVHADLSEFNILFGDRPVVIDMGQSVTIDHPRAFSFLKRDIANINHFFFSRCELRDERELFTRITGLVFPDMVDTEQQGKRSDES